jgi:hypothetical protein
VVRVRRQRDLERAEAEADREHRGDERADARGGEGAEAGGARGVRGARCRARQRGQHRDRAREHGDRGEDHRRGRLEEHDERGGDERGDREDRLGQHRVERERALQQAGAVAEEDRVLRAQHRRGRRERAAGDEGGEHDGRGAGVRARQRHDAEDGSRMDRGEQQQHARTERVDDPRGDRRADPAPERERPGGGAGRAERPGLGLDQQHDRQPVDPERQPREQRRREQPGDAWRAEDLAVPVHLGPPR